MTDIYIGGYWKSLSLTEKSFKKQISIFSQIWGNGLSQEFFSTLLYNWLHWICMAMNRSVYKGLKKKKTFIQQIFFNNLLPCKHTQFSGEYYTNQLYTVKISDSAVNL